MSSRCACIGRAPATPSSSARWGSKYATYEGGGRGRWCRQQGSNLRPPDYKSGDLPTELCRQKGPGVSGASADEGVDAGNASENGLASGWTPIPHRQSGRSLRYGLAPQLHDLPGLSGRLSGCPTLELVALMGLIRPSQAITPCSVAESPGWPTPCRPGGSSCPGGDPEPTRRGSDQADFFSAWMRS